MLDEVPVVPGAERQKRNQREPHGGRAGDRKHHLEGGQPHCSGEWRNDGADAGQKATHEQAAKPVFLVELADTALGIGTGILLDPTEECLGAVFSTKEVGYSRADDVPCPSDKENGEG